MSFGDKKLDDAYDRWATQTPEEYYGYDEVAICLECKKPFNCETDIQLCDKCMKLFDLDKLWDLNDKGKLDALDFNESSKLREKFRRKIDIMTKKAKAYINKCKMLGSKLEKNK